MIDVIVKKENRLIFFFTLAIIMGTSYNTYLSFERFRNYDSDTYLNIANGKFKEESLVRRYRVIVPFAARAVSVPLQTVYYKIWRHKRSDFNWPLLMGFYLINSILLSLAAVLIFQICKTYNASGLGALFALIVFCTGGRWLSFNAGHPSTDSLVVLCIAAMIYCCRKRNDWLMAAALIIGPFSKESFLFFIPFAFYYSKSPLIKTGIYIITGLLLYCLLRFIIDSNTGVSFFESWKADGENFGNMALSLQRIFSVKGMGELFTDYGLFTLLPLLLLARKSYRQLLVKQINWFHFSFAAIILLHILLSEEVSRMLFLGSALWMVLFSKSFDYSFNLIINKK